MSSLVPETVPAPAPVRRHTLTGAAAVLLALLVSVLGALVDELTGRGIGAIFGVSFIAGCALAAARVRRSGLRSVAVAPPLLYALGALLAASVRDSAAPRTASTRLMDLVTELVFGAPYLVTGTLVTLGVVLLRISQRR